VCGASMKLLGLQACPLEGDGYSRDIERSRKSGVASVIVVLAAWLASVPVIAADIEPTAPVLAAKTLLGAIEQAVATLNRCREVDSSNAVIYNGLLVTFGLQNLPVIERLDDVLRGEGARSGHGETYFLPLYSDTRKQVEQEVEGTEAQVGAARFLADCRGLSDRADQHTDMFAPLSDRFPAEIRTIDEWH
jgi:hypothetical protein